MKFFIAGEIARLDQALTNPLEAVGKRSVAEAYHVMGLILAHIESIDPLSESQCILAERLSIPVGHEFGLRHPSLGILELACPRLER